MYANIYVWIEKSSSTISLLCDLIWVVETEVNGANVLYRMLFFPIGEELLEFGQIELKSRKNDSDKVCE